MNTVSVKKIIHYSEKRKCILFCKIYILLYFWVLFFS